jgi:hypothetical protein
MSRLLCLGKVRWQATIARVKRRLASDGGSQCADGGDRLFDPFAWPTRENLVAKPVIGLEYETGVGVALSVEREGPCQLRRRGETIDAGRQRFSAQILTGEVGGARVPTRLLDAVVVSFCLPGKGIGRMDHPPVTSVAGTPSPRCTYTACVGATRRGRMIVATSAAGKRVALRGIWPSRRGRQSADAGNQGRRRGST